MTEYPTTVAAALDVVAKFMSLGDEAVQIVAAATDQTPPPRSEQVQGDLRMWAAWLREHPDVDEQMRAVSSLSEEAPRG